MTNDFWELCKRTAQDIEKWPEWKKKAVGYRVKKTTMDTPDESKCSTPIDCNTLRSMLGYSSSSCPNGSCSSVSNKDSIEALQQYIREMAEMLSVENWNGTSTDMVVQSALSEALEEVKRSRSRADKAQSEIERLLGAVIEFRSDLLKKYQPAPCMDSSERWPPSIARIVKVLDTAIDAARKLDN